MVLSNGDDGTFCSSTSAADVNPPSLSNFPSPVNLLLTDFGPANSFLRFIVGLFTFDGPGCGDVIGGLFPSATCGFS